jgi:DNA uptake protein ComE-like DNA-binding protein
MLLFLENFKTWFRDYFYYTKTERKGVTALLILLLFLVVAPQFFYLFKDEKTTNFTDFENEIAAFNANLEEDDDAAEGEKQRKYANNYTPSGPAQSFSFDPNTASETDFIKLGLSPKTAGTIVKYRSKGGKFRSPDDFGKIYSIKPDDLARLKPLISIAQTESGYKDYKNKNEAFANKNDKNAPPAKAENFAFDPNTAEETDFLRLGLSPKTAASILNYRNKGGKFKTKEDFKKIYTLSPEDFTRLEPFITIVAAPANFPKPIAQNAAQNGTTNSTAPSVLAPNTNAAFTPKRKNATIKIDINTAQVEDWEQLRGVGIGYANRINAYREKLGGFVKTEQIKEIYNFPDSIYQRMLPQLIVGNGVRKININTLAAADLKNHPYLGWKLANVIVSYREQNGKYKQATDVKKIVVMTDDIYTKILPYISVE